MDTLASIARWVLFGSVYGLFGVAAVIYFLLKLVKRKVPRFPEPALIVVPLLIIGLLVLPSIPRYEFERSALSDVNGKPWIRVINKTQWADFTEPLTLIHAPVGSIFAVMPENPLYGGGYLEVLMRYDEETRVTMTEPDCADGSIMRSEPDSSGVFRYTTREARPMTPAETALYCKYDWSKEKAALLAEMSTKANAK